MIITMQHIRTVPTWTNREGFCAVNTRLFFKQYNLDLRDFINNGIPEEKLLATGDALAIRVVEWAHQQEHQ